MNFAKYNKFWVALTMPLSALLIALAPTETEAAFTLNLNELYMIVVAAASALGVKQIPNR